MSRSHIPISRSGVKAWCMNAFGRGMAAQAAKVGSPQEVFDLWWTAVAGPDPKPSKTRAWPDPYPVAKRRAKRGGGE